MNEIKIGKIKSYYLLVGENEFSKDAFIKSIKNTIINEKFKETDFITLYGDDCSINNIMPWLYSPPFGSNKKLLVIKRAEKLSQEDKELIQKYINNPSNTSVVILTMNKDKIDHFSNIIECKNLSKNSIERWIKSYVKDRGFDIEDDAISFLYETFETDQFALSTELDKIMSCSPSMMITIHSIENIKEISTPKYIIYSLTHSIANKDLDAAYKKLHLILEFDNSPKIISNVLWKIYDHFDKLLRIKINPYDVPKNYANKYIEEASLWEEENLLDAFCFLFDADFSIKIGRVDKEFALEELIYKLCCC